MNIFKEIKGYGVQINGDDINYEGLSLNEVLKLIGQNIKLNQEDSDQLCIKMVKDDGQFEIEIDGNNIEVFVIS